MPVMQHTSTQNAAIGASQLKKLSKRGADGRNAPFSLNRNAHTLENTMP